jgi:dihydrolipoamide dehydrogenase
MYHQAKHNFSDFGIDGAEGVRLNLPKMLAQKDRAVKTLTGGIEMLFKKNKVINVKGLAKIVGPNDVEVVRADGQTESWRAKNIVIATGSEIQPLQGLAIDEKTVVSSTGALSLEKVPKRLAVIGGGIIGLELVRKPS